MRYWLPLVSWYSSTRRWSNRLASASRILERSEQFLDAQEQIVEIDGPGGLQGVLIAAVARGRQVLLVGFGQRGGPVGDGAGRLPASDEIEQVARPQQALGRLDFPQGRAGDAFLIAAVIDGEGRRIAQSRDMAAKDAHAKGMERRNLRLPLACVCPTGRWRAAAFRRRPCW